MVQTALRAIVKRPRGPAWIVRDPAISGDAEIAREAFPQRICENCILRASQSATPRSAALHCLPNWKLGGIPYLHWRRDVEPLIDKIAIEKLYEG